MKHRIVLTGGGSAGHVTPNMALIEALREQGWSMAYIGARDGVEKQMIAPLSIPYYGIRCGKLRRYFSWKNFIDPFNTLWGIMQAFVALVRFKPHVVFSKGGFVAFPVVVAAKVLGIPVVAHESDCTPGLANRLSFPFVDHLCVTFEAAKKHFKRPDKVVHTGTPLRAALFHGDSKRGLALCGFDASKPCLLVMGGGQGSLVINQCIREGLDRLLSRYQIIHLCGSGKVDVSLVSTPGYKQLEYATTELPDLLAASTFIISRAGANTLYEILALAKPHILIPLSKASSRGDQIQNAQYYQQQGISEVIDEEVLTLDRLQATLDVLEVQQRSKIERMHALNIQSATENVVQVIRSIVDRQP